MEKTKVAILGMGTVGCGVAALLVDHGDRTARHAGRTLWLENAVVRDLQKSRDFQPPAGVLTDDLDAVLANPEITVVAQLIGGIEPARTIMLRCLESGKDVVTANKALLAQHGSELFSRARALGRTIAFEASVAGGIPIIANISQCLSANGIQLLEGILNGTSNFIVSQMEQHGMAYADAVRLAQDKGYAEADPTMDVDGTDAAQKLAILAHLAFGAEVDWAQIPRIGVDLLETQDLQFAAQLGYRIKLLATANLTDDGLELHVSPTLVRRGTPLAEVTDAFNAVHVVGDAVGPVFYHGQGAGQMPTASAVVADLIDTAVGRAKLTFNTLEYFSTEQPPRVKLRDHDQLSGRMYFRMAVKDSPGTLASITGAMGKHGISIASVIQHESRSDSEDDTLPLVIMTSAAPEGAAAAAAAVMEDLPSVAGRVVRLRVKD
ncbi:MAG: homoserine dehydrogenase [Planctomycetota bacterium]